MRLPIALAAAFCVAVLPGSAAAQNGHANGHATTHGQGANHGAGKPATPASEAKTPPGQATGNPHKTPASTTAGTTTTAATTTIAANTPIAGHAANPQLAARLLQLLPAGSTIQTASAGFKNWGQFVAAVHVSHNLGIPFASLKAKMTGTNPLSLGQAIQALHPSTTATTTSTTTSTSTKVRSEVKKAESEAAEDLREAAEEAREAAEEAREAANESHK